MENTLRFRRLHDDAVVPVRAHAGDAGYDLSSLHEVRIAPGETVLVETGVAIALPRGTVGLVCPRSGLAGKHGVTVLNGPGVIDEGYRGHVKVLLVNLGAREMLIAPGDRIAQLVVTAYEAPATVVVDSFEDETDRGDRGFGSTGLG